jgi:hypothetical protein
MYYEEDIPPTVELEANIDFVKAKSKAIGDLLKAMQDFKPNLEKFGLNPIHYYAWHDHLSEELLKSETEREILENDLAKERWRASASIS